tara:strand:- start:62 stop:379 length:318 start_codon:yes stop_codon:yes gene_type:complete
MKVYYKALLGWWRGDSYYVVDTSQFRVDATCKELIDTGDYYPSDALSECTDIPISRNGILDAINLGCILAKSDAVLWQHSIKIENRRKSRYFKIETDGTLHKKKS